MPADAAAHSSPSVPELQRRVDELAAELRARTADNEEALQREAAVAEVLQVINSSSGELAPVLDAMLQKATSLCEAAFGILWTYDGEYYHAVAFRDVPQAYVEFLRKSPPAGPEDALGRLAAGASLVQVPDMTDLGIGRPLMRKAVELGGFRTVAAVALRKEGMLLGAFTIYRQEVRLFSDKQIALLQNFAAQAVIAMESAQLLSEQRKALEQQTATAEVLQVISQSRTDVKPVLDAVAAAACRFCGAIDASIILRDGDELVRAAHEGPLGTGGRGKRDRLDRSTVMGRSIVDGDVVHVPDVQQLDPVAYARARELAQQIGWRAALSAPMLRDDGAIGCILLRRPDPGRFTPRQIELLETFAAQAVIAIENARLLIEQREALERQTATAEVLQVINSSPGDLAPVFDATLEKATRLCGVPYGQLALFDGEFFRFVAVHGEAPFKRDLPRDPRHPSWGITWPRFVAGEDVVHIPDVVASETYRSGHDSAQRLVEIGNGRSLLAVALRKDRQLLGALTVYSQQVQPFSDKQIVLLQSFAAQAVIAMENARLLDELHLRTRDLQESLEYQTATSDVLKVISRSTFDLQPVLDTLVETAGRLCAADTAHIVIRHGEAYRAVATFGLEADFDAFVRGLSFTPGRGSVVGRVLLDGQAVHVEDAAADPEYRVLDAVRRGSRTVLGVPLLREGELVGVIVLVRLRVEPFSERQIEIISTFADQAVIAMENARLLGELTRREQELSVTFEHMGDGVVMFDGELRIAAWNRNFQETARHP